MTEDILFDNIYIGHSLEDAQALAKETYEIKKAIEAEAKKAAQAGDEDETASEVSWKEDPVAFIRAKAYDFIEAAKVDPVGAFKSQPETGAALTLVLVTFFGIMGTLLGLIGGQQKPITKVSILETKLLPIPELTCVSYSSLSRRPMLPLLTIRLPKPRPMPHLQHLREAKRLRLLSRNASKYLSFSLWVAKILETRYHVL
jgi:hypothetical protein